MHFVCVSVCMSAASKDRNKLFISILFFFNFNKYLFPVDFINILSVFVYSYLPCDNVTTALGF